MAKTTPPPVDSAGELDKANKMLRRFRRQLNELPHEWAAWLVSSLAAGYAETTEDSET